jgi:hypothetical protein
LNMFAIVVTLEVFQLETSTDVNTLQLRNILSIDVTLPVFHFDTSRPVSALQS